MGLLSRAAKDEEPDTSGNQEETYERLFPKIGRDFVYREDLKAMLRDIMFVLDPLGLSPIDLDRNSAGKALALEYKNNIESGRIPKNKYTDLIILDDEEDKKKKDKKKKKKKDKGKDGTRTEGKL